MDTVPYVVQVGDYLRQLAGRFGFDADTVWALPENAGLRRQGRTPDMLNPGDVLMIPEPPQKRWLPITTGATNRFTASPIMAGVKVCLCSTKGKPLAGEPYVVIGADLPPGNLDDGGHFIASVPTWHRSLVVHLTKRNEQYTIQIGALDPPATRSGMLARLIQLGCFPHQDGADVTVEDHLQAGIVRFQLRYSMTITGKMDVAIINKVTEVFGL